MASHVRPRDGREQNTHRLADGWQGGTVESILDNPRYTGHAIFGRWTKHEMLLDSGDVAAGHVVRFRKSTPDRIVRSRRPAHPGHRVGRGVHAGAVRQPTKMPRESSYISPEWTVDVFPDVDALLVAVDSEPISVSAHGHVVIDLSRRRGRTTQRSGRFASTALYGTSTTRYWPCLRTCAGSRRGADNIATV
jgi:hypothetical protein